jgi:phosphohistidine phosphatase
MERMLLVLRHGKSLRGPEFATDFERPLAPRGIKAARRMGRFLRERGLVPQLIMTSAAQRALSTARLVQQELKDARLVIDQDFYDADIGDVHDSVARTGDEVTVLLIVGHNPTWEMVVDDITGTYDTVLKTCSLAVIRCDCATWADIGRRDGDLLGVFHPRELPD